MVRRVSVLGSTGSIGRQTVALARGQKEEIEVAALTGYDNVALLAKQALELRPEVAVIGNPARGQELNARLSGSGVEAAAGAAAVVEAAAREVDSCVAAIVGKAGLSAAVAALGNAAALALANKESLAAAGELLLAKARALGTVVVTLDSEHHAIDRLLAAHGYEGLRRVVLTASGGPFRTWPRERMAAVTVEDALRHPKWRMGDRLTLGSASLFNKAIEIIEAHHLFGLPSDQIDVLIHPQCVAHGLVEYGNGQWFAQMAAPEMRVVIADALGWEMPHDDVPGAGWRLEPEGFARLEFEPPDPTRFPALRLARVALARGGLSGCILNAAHEVALDFVPRG